MTKIYQAWINSSELKTPFCDFENDDLGKLADAITAFCIDDCTAPECTKLIITDDETGRDVVVSKDMLDSLNRLLDAKREQILAEPDQRKEHGTHFGLGE